MGKRRARPRGTATEAALSAISRRALSEAELRAALERKGYLAGEAEEAAARLKEWRYVGDDALADDAAARATVRRVGRRRAARELSARGIDEGTVDAAIARHYEGRDDELLSQALEESLRQMGGARSAKGMARLGRRLVARGFDPEKVYERLRSAGLAPESEEP